MGALPRARRVWVGKRREVAVQFFRAVVPLRLGERGLQDLNEENGWLEDNATGEIAAFASFTGDEGEVSWLPKEVVAKSCEAAR